jgi:hypothetical protein
VNSAIKSFEKKFKDKTKNDWDKRDNFVAHAGKYTLIEMDTNVEEEVETVTNSSTTVCFLFYLLKFRFFIFIYVYIIKIFNFRLQ